MVLIRKTGYLVVDVPRYDIVKAERREDGSTHVKLKDGSEGIVVQPGEVEAEREANAKTLDDFYKALDEREADKRSGLQQFFEDYNKT